MSMKTEGTWMWILGALALTACPSSEDPKGDGTETSTSPDTDTDPSPTTAADTTAGPDSDCGNGAIEDGEQCDGTELGGASCTDVNPAYSGGTLVCGESCTFDASGCELPPDTALMVINEITSEAVLAGDFMGPNDALELYNAGTAAADLSGWQISDDPTLPAAKTYTLPDGTTLEPGEFLVLLSLDETQSTGELPFGISDSTIETLVLADASSEPIDLVTVDGYLARVSYCRVPDGTGAWFQCEQTFGSENVEADAACGNDVIDDGEQCDGELGGETCQSIGLGYAGGTLACAPTCRLDVDACTTDGELVLNELSSSTDGIEIFNGSNAAVDLSGWVLTDDRVTPDYDVELDTAELVFQAGTVLEPGEYLVVPQGVGPNQHPFGLGMIDDRVTLLDPSPLTVIDQVTYDDSQALLSWCRLPNGPGGTWNWCTPTMGSANLPE